MKFNLTANADFEASSVGDAVDRVIEHLLTLSEGDTDHQPLDFRGIISIGPAAPRKQTFAEFLTEFAKDDAADATKDPHYVWNHLRGRS